jgi:hypothetical protein
LLLQRACRAWRSDPSSRLVEICPDSEWGTHGESVATRGQGACAKDTPGRATCEWAFGPFGAAYRPGFGPRGSQQAEGDPMFGSGPADPRLPCPRDPHRERLPASGEGPTPRAD